MTSDKIGASATAVAQGQTSVQGMTPLEETEIPPFMHSRLGIAVTGAIPIAVLILAWLLLPYWRPDFLRLVLPDLGPTVDYLVDDLFVSGIGRRAASFTMRAWAMSLALAGVSGTIVGAVVGLSPTAFRVLYPTTVAFQAIPKIAIAPLLILVFGFGIASKVAIGSIIAFFPIMVGVMQGMRAVRGDELDLMRTLGASKWQVFRMVRVPRAIPSTAGGFQLAGIYALLGVIVGEFLGSTDGLGYLIALRAGRLHVAGVWSAVLVISAAAVALTLGLSYLDRRVSSWEEA